MVRVSVARVKVGVRVRLPYNLTLALNRTCGDARALEEEARELTAHRAQPDLRRPRCGSPDLGQPRCGSPDLGRPRCRSRGRCRSGGHEVEREQPAEARRVRVERGRRGAEGLDQRDRLQRVRVV